MVFPQRYLPVNHGKLNKHLLSLGLAFLLLPASLCAEPLTESLSIELGLKHENFLQLLESYNNAAQGEITRSKTWRNPELELSREEAGSETEISIMLKQPLDISGKRAIKSEVAKLRLGTTDLDNQLLHIERRGVIRKKFYEVLFQQLKQETLASWLVKFSELENTMMKREAAGDVSGYDRRRISQEKFSLVAQQGEITAELDSAWRQLKGYFSPGDTSGFRSVDGELLPEKQASLQSLLDKLEQLPGLLKQQRLSESYQLTAKAIKRSQIPDLTIGLGHKQIDGPGESVNGFLLSASLPLPIFDRKQGELQQARAEIQASNHQFQLAQQLVEVNIRSLWHKANQLRDNATLFKKQIINSAELITIAEAAYHASELGVLELIDAYRSNLLSEMRAHHMTMQARLVQIELDQISQGIRQ